MSAKLTRLRLKQLGNRIEQLRQTCCSEVERNCQACKCHVEEDAGYYCGLGRMLDAVEKMTEGKDTDK